MKFVREIANGKRKETPIPLYFTDVEKNVAKFSRQLQALTYEKEYRLNIPQTGGKVSELMELWEKRTRKPFTEKDYRKHVDSLIAHLKIVDTLADFR